MITRSSMQVIPSVLFCFVLCWEKFLQLSTKQKGASGIFWGKNGPPSSHIMRRKKCEATIFKQQVPKTMLSTHHLVRGIPKVWTSLFYLQPNLSKCHPTPRVSIKISQDIPPKNKLMSTCRDDSYHQILCGCGSGIQS